MNNKGITEIELIITILAIMLIALFIYVMAAYGDKPVSEMPVWVWWLLSD